MKKFSIIFLLGTLLVAPLSCKKGDSVTAPGPSKAVNPLKVTASASAVKSHLSSADDGSLVWDSYDDLGLYAFDVDSYIENYEQAPVDIDERANWVRNNLIKSGVANISISSADPGTADFYTADENKDWVGGDSGEDNHRYMFLAYYPSTIKDGSLPFYISPYRDYWDPDRGETVRQVIKGVQFTVPYYQDGVSYGKYQILVDNGGFTLNNFDKDDTSTWGNTFYTRSEILNGTKQIEFHGMKPITSMIRFRMKSTDGNSYNIRRLECELLEGGEDYYGLSGTAYYDLQDGLLKTMQAYYGTTNKDFCIEFDSKDRSYLTVGPEPTDWFYAVILPSYKKVTLRFNAISYRNSDVALLVTKTSPSREVDGVLKEGFFPGELYSVTLEMTPPQQLEGEAGQYLVEPWD